ncbi:MAG TPA: hypothetical protein VF292_03785 [Rhodanobacteraceae bacterium]
MKIHTPSRWRRASLAVALLTAMALTLPCLAQTPPAPPPGHVTAVPVPAPAAYSLPIATVIGTGSVRFHITLGMLLDRREGAVGFYRSYPSRSRRSMSEQYSLPMFNEPAGVILASDGKTPLLALHGYVANGPGRHALRLDYLQDIATHRYGHCALWLTHAGRSWRFTTSRGTPITTFRVHSGLTGITSITPCGQAPQ